jgi:type II secretory pathway pseudopilin PulG
VRPPSSNRFRTRGISLVEALVAMIVLSVGTLAVLGVQATLRFNSDVAKQRAEAVRIGQAFMETWRGYIALDGDAEGAVYFEDIADDEQEVAGLNATYTVTLGVPQELPRPRLKALEILVTWQDRSGQTQTVRLNSGLAGVDPALSGTLGIGADTSALVNPGGRHPAIPRDAIPIEGESGRSQFTPPGAADGVRWVFDNTTGFIVSICSGPSDCVDTSARLLAGFVDFSLTDTPNSELPDSPRLPDTQVKVMQTLPAEVIVGDGTVECYEDPTPTSYVAYYCAVPVGTQPFWSGRSLVYGTGISTVDALSTYKVCRYTPYVDAHRTVPDQMRNEEHPQFYVDVGSSLINQNFLVIRAVDGAGAAIACPVDGGLTPVDGRTFRHQPAS